MAHQKFKNIVLMGRSNTEGVGDTLQLLISFLQQEARTIFIEEETMKIISCNNHKIIPRTELAKYGDLLIVVGGDGSLLAAARIAAEQNLPVLGVNRGSLGFLTDINPDELRSIGSILEGDYLEEPRFLLKIAVNGADGSNLIQATALNDIVLLPTENNRMIEFEVYINKQFVCLHKADGIIVATPTGSTAHALSGGGPILHPFLEAVVLLPMFPHNLSSRPIVVSSESVIEIVMAKHCKATPNISCDGQKLIPIPEGGKIIVKKHHAKLRLIHLTHYNYYETLRVKLNWENRC